MLPRSRVDGSYGDQGRTSQNASQSQPRSLQNEIQYVYLCDPVNSGALLMLVAPVVVFFGDQRPLFRGGERNKRGMEQEEREKSSASTGCKLYGEGKCICFLGLRAYGEGKSEMCK